MKQLISLLTIFTILTADVFAQRISGHHPHTALKIAPAGIFIGKVTVGGEYNFKHRNSITFLAGIPFDQNSTLEFDGEKNKVTSKAFSLMAGFRHYLGQKSMSGFYIEPYAKYLTHEAKGLLHGELGGDKVIFDSHSDYKGIGIGAQLGVQFVIAKAVIFDMFLVGPEVNSADHTSRFTDITNHIGWNYADANEAEQMIKDVLNDIPVVGNKVAVTVDTNNQTISTKYSGFTPGFRFGASVGVKF